MLIFFAVFSESLAGRSINATKGLEYLFARLHAIGDQLIQGA